VYGGAIYAEYGDLRLVNADFVDNDVSGVYEVYGSLMYLYQADGQVYNTTTASVDFGDATTYGALYIESSDVVEQYNNLHDTPSDEGWIYDEDHGALSDAPTYRQNPQYTDRANGDYTLSGSSSLVDGGHPDILDVDGSRSDVGAFGGPGGDSW
jgi:hypothetical protein